MSLKFSFILIISFFLHEKLNAQQSRKQRNVATANNNINKEDNLSDIYLKVGDTVYIMKGNCKNSWKLLFTKAVEERDFVTITPDNTPFLEVHGNILYNFSYRSFIDTPFAQKNLQQHLVQTNLTFLVKGKYPVQMTLSNRSSNSAYFKNITDVNINFKQQLLLGNIKRELSKKLEGKVDVDAIKEQQDLLETKKRDLNSLKNWVNSPARAAELVREKERILLIAGAPFFKNDNSFDAETYLPQSLSPSLWASKLKNKGNEKLDSLKKQTTAVDSSSLEKFNKKKEQLAKLSTMIKEGETRLKNIRKTVRDSLSNIKNEIAALQTSSGLLDYMKKHGITKNELTKMQRTLLAVNHLGIGRTWIDYSELTVKNLTITGIDAEINPGNFYFAFAAGKVNYRFRDFILKKNENELPDQSLYIVRAGIGKKGNKNFILSFYNGKKVLLNNIAGNPATSQRILGFSAEAKYVINPYNYIIGEFAKSSFNNISGSQPPSSDLFDKAFNLKIRSNEAYSIKLFNENPSTHTRFQAYYKKTGEHFQSFNLMPVNTNQDAWMLKLNQLFWKKRLIIDAAVRKNDFTSPLALPSYSNKNVFKSLQASFRMPKYPFVSFGYYPSSQLSVSNNNTLVENQYNTLNTIISHSYRYKKTAMNTNIVFTRFYNNSSDTGFIYFNATNLSIGHSIFLGKANLQSTVGLIDQSDLRLFTLEQMMNYQLSKMLYAGGSLKWNRVDRNKNMLGASANISLAFSKLGTFQFNYEKTYLPAYNRILMPVDIGRISFYRQF